MPDDLAILESERSKLLKHFVWFGRPEARFDYRRCATMWQAILLSPEDKGKLTWLSRRPKTAQRVALRSKIVLRAAEGRSNQEIARGLGITGATVGKWRERFRLQGMEGLSDEPRPGTPRKISDAQVEEAVT